MIYCFIVPYLDVEGRIEANPKLMKGEIAPLLDHVTPEVIDQVLQELHDIELITLYSNETGKKAFLQLTQFDKHQRNLRKDKEAKTQIPAPTPEFVRPRSVPTTELVPLKIKRSLSLREGKENEHTLGIDNSDAPVDNSPSKEAFLQKYQELGEDISALFTDQRQQRQIALFVEAHIKNGNLQAIIHCLESLLSSQRKNQVINPKAYLEKIFAVENGNFNEQENIARSDAHKKDFASIGDVFAGMKGREP